MSQPQEDHAEETLSVGMANDDYNRLLCRQHVLYFCDIMLGSIFLIF